MCSVLLFRESFPEAPLAVFFVRDEELGRGGSAPELLGAGAAVLAPREPRAGGTWFGCTRRGFLAGLVNRRDDPLPAAARSRGLLLLDSLTAAGAAAALHHAVAQAAAAPHGGCTMFAGDRSGLWWLDLPAGGAPPAGLRRLGPGAWLLRHRHQPEPAPARFLPQGAEPVAAWRDRVHAAVASHEPAGDALCVHGRRHGSVDTSCAALDRAGRPLFFSHHRGAPCQGRFADYLPADWRN